MDLDLSKAQQLLQSSVRDFLARECPLERVRELMAAATACDDALWSGIADQGWLGLTLPEEAGGLGMGAVELAAVAEAMGEHCLPGPFLSNLWAATALSACDHPAARRWLKAVAAGEKIATVALLEDSGDWRSEAVAATASKSGGVLTVSGRKRLVGDAARADLILWVGRIEEQLAILPIERRAAGVELEECSVIDETRKLYDVVLDGVQIGDGDVLARGDQAALALDGAQQLATVATCGELVGGMQWILKTTVEYAKSRQQFAKVIGSFQAVQHHCADILLYLEASRSATYNAAYLLSVGAPEARRAVSIAKAYCSDAGREAGNLGIQVHGGIGFTWEHDLHLFFKRAKACETLFGDATFHRERLAEAVIDRVEAAASGDTSILDVA